MQIIESFSEKDTYEAGKKLGLNAGPGDVIALVGDLGVGKTHFTAGFAKGYGIDDQITSPTFTIMQEYHQGGKALYHMDVYRIEDVEELEETGFLDGFCDDGACLIEWADMIKDVLPSGVTVVTICKDLEKGLNYRKITVDETK